MIEQPPNDLPDPVKEYLSRLIKQILETIDGKTAVAKKTNKLPPRPEFGMILYFTSPIPGHVNAPGLHWFDGTTWQTL